jgi:hypothetical protein
MAIDFKTDIDGTAFNGITGLASVVSPVNGVAAVGTSTTVARQDHVHGTDTTRAPVASPTFTGNATFTGLAYQPYHAVSDGQYFFDSYNGDRNLRWYVQGAYSDIIRNQPYSATEYWDGSAWVAWTATSLFDVMLDGQRNTGTGSNKTGTNGITNTTKKFRFEVTASTGWPTQAIFWVETSWVGFTYPGLTAQIEKFNTTTNTWTTPITTTFTTANSVTNWGLAGFVTTSGLHNGYSKTRITLEFGTLPTTDTYTSVDIRNIMITSNFGGTSNILPFSTDYGKNVTFGGSLTVPSSVKLNNLTASQTLELDASKNIISAAKQTGYNLALSTTATNIKVNGTQSLGSLSTLARADHVHPTDTSRAPTVSPTFTGTVVLPSEQALISPLLTTPIMGGTGAVFNGATSGAITLRAAAVAGANTLTLPATSGTLATVGGTETLGGKTLTSPTFTGTVTGISKGMVGLGRVDDTADEDKPVSTDQQTALDLKLNTEDLGEILGDAEVRSATRLYTARTIGGVSFNGTANINLPGVNAAGNQSTTGNAATATKLTSAKTIGGVSFDGSANIPQRQVTHHSASFTFAVNTKQYIGLLDSDSESITPSNINLPFLAPFSGKLLKIFVRSGNNLQTGNLTLRLEKNALDVNAGGTPTVVTNNPAAQLGPSNSTMKTYDWTSLSNTINAGDMIFISIASSTAFTGVKIFFTCLWEWDH